MADALLLNTFQKISPAYELVADVTVGTAINRVDFNGLSFGKDDDLLLVIDLLGNNGLLNLYVNDNVTDTNYWRQGLNAVDTTVSASRVNSSTILAGTSGLRELLFAKLKLANSGYFVVQTERNTNYGLSSVGIGNIYLSSTFTITSITKLSLITSANNIGIGSRFQLYRLKAKKVADVIVSSATTQVDITGLNIDKDSEYLLVADMKNGITTSNSKRLFFNDNNLDASYYMQSLESNSTTVSGARSNASAILYTENAINYDKSFAYVNIKLSNNGYIIAQANENRLYGGIYPILRKTYITSTYTTSLITKITILSTVANGIGIGSRFTLYRLDDGVATPDSSIRKVGNLVYMTSDSAPSPYVATVSPAPTSNSAYMAFDATNSTGPTWNYISSVAWAKMTWTAPIRIREMIVRANRSGQTNTAIRVYGIKADASEVSLYSASPSNDTDITITPSDTTTPFVGVRMEIDGSSDLIVSITNCRITQWYTT